MFIFIAVCADFSLEHFTYNSLCCLFAVYEYLVGSLKKTLFYFLEMDRYLSHLRGAPVYDDTERRCVMVLSRLLQNDWKWEEQGQPSLMPKV